MRMSLQNKSKSDNVEMKSSEEMKMDANNQSENEIPTLHVRPIKVNLGNEFSDSEIFLVDGDSLLVSAMNDENLCWCFGGEMLHLVYLIERKLNMFVRKGGKFRVVFFKEIGLLLWQNRPSTQLAREVLILHLRCHTTIDVLDCFNSPWEPSFSCYIKKHIPTFMLISDQGISRTDVQLRNMMNTLSSDLSHDLFEWMMNKMLHLHLNVAFLNNVTAGVSTLDGFHITYSSSHVSLYQEVEFLNFYQTLLMAAVDEREEFAVDKFSNMVGFEQYEDIQVECYGVLFFLQNCQDHENLMLFKDFAILFLIHVLIKRKMPLKYRSFPPIKIHDDFDELVFNLQYALIDAISFLKDTVKYNFFGISDIWDGNLLMNVAFNILRCYKYNTEICFEQDIIESCKDIMATVYDHLKFVDTPISPYFTSHSLLIEIMEEIEMKYTEIDNLALETPEIIPINSELLQLYAGDIYNTLNVLDDQDRIDELVPDYQKFEDRYHWHCKKMLNEDGLMFCKKKPIASSSSEDEAGLSSYQIEAKRKDATWRKRRKQRKETQLEKFYELYGRTLEGEIVNRKPIVMIEEATKQKVTVASSRNKKAVVKKKDLIIAANKEGKQKAEKESDDKCWSEVLVKTKQLRKDGGVSSLIEALAAVGRAEKILKNSQVLKEAYMHKIHLYKILLKEEADEQKRLKHGTAVFLLVRTLCLEMQGLLTSKDREKISSMLRLLNFSKLVKNLGFSEDEETVDNDLCHIEFQLQHLGHLLLRDIRTDKDNRVDEFIPDTWQRELFDTVDKNQSALIVAPTSSGKTYASYYCMKKVLQRSNDDVVVYVSPTKALCNQVNAMVYAKFKSKQMPPGKSVCGIFTRDYRQNVTNCQILVTVPQCFEILLLSVDSFTWSQKVKYVIFDEIHCIGAEFGAEIWEHLLMLISCPFLALSATVENPDSLQKWLQTAQTFQRKKEDMLFKVRPEESYKVNMVIVEGRHSDLKKYVFLPEKANCKAHNTDLNALQHLHPCSTLSIPVVQCRGIPDHMSLSPRECLDLFNVMKIVWPEKEELKRLVPDVYFDEHKFLARLDVKKYEKELKNELSSWVLFQEKFSQVLDILNEPVRNQEQVSMNILRKDDYHHIKLSFLTLLKTLEQNDMLPVIVFCMQRHLCEKLVEIVVEYCEEEEQSYREKRGKKWNRKEENTMGSKEKQIHKKMKDKEPVPDYVRNKRNDDTNFWLDHEQFSGVTFKGVGMVDNEDIKGIYYRVESLAKNGNERDLMFMKGIRYGVSYHHAGLSAKLRSTAEMLFRKKFVRVLISTSTLALGIHAPCRTVVLGGDSVYLTSLMYRQMSGRAGRRGFDMTGNVIFDWVPKQKVCRLISGNLPKLLGNFPISVSLCLRLLILVKEVRSHGNPSPEAQKDTIARALTLLRHPLILQEYPEFDEQFKHHFLFSVQFLLREGLLDTEAVPQGLAGLAAHLHYHEPANYAFISCLGSGLFHDLCQSEDARNRDGSFSEDLMRKFVLILSHFFTKTEVHPLHLQKVRRSNSIVELPALPEEFKENVESYNERVNNIFDMYLWSVATYVDEKRGEDNVLPLSGVTFKSVKDFVEPAYGTVESLLYNSARKNQICSSFAALSSHTDSNLYDPEKLISNIRHQVFTDVKVIPTIDLNVKLNSYALDFFKHGIKEAIIVENGLQHGEVFDKLKDFMLVIQAIAVSFELFTEDHTDEKDVVAKAFRQLADTYNEMFNKAFM